MTSPSETPSVDPAHFRRVMGRFATGVTVITAEADGQVRGMTANAFMSGSLDPPLLIISVGKRAAMHAHLLAAGRFAVNILCVDHRDLATHFAGRPVEGLTVELAGIDGIPTLAGCSAVMTAETTATHECGDHTIFVGRILTMTAESQPPLLFHAGQYGTLAAQPDSGPASKGDKR